MSHAALVAALREQERSWESRPMLRALYEGWFRRICGALASVPGRSIELGAGIGMLARTCPSVEPTDVAPTPWASEVVDAEALPYADGSLANLVLVDVFHHLARPTRFLDEATRALAPGGRLVVLDPYCSPISTIAYRRFHHERTDLGADPFRDDPSVADDPLASNQARATLVFFRHAHELPRRWPQLALLRTERFALLAYPLSGGFTGRKLVPDGLGSALARAERLCAHAAPLLAFRCLVVLERQSPPVPDSHHLDPKLPEGE